MAIVIIMMLVSATLSWAAIRHCPLARAISCQIDQVAEASR